MLETLDYTIRIGSTPIYKYAYFDSYGYVFLLRFCLYKYTIFFSSYCIKSSIYYVLNHDVAACGQLHWLWISSPVTWASPA